MGDVLDPGPVDILTDGCVGAAFAGAACSGTPVSVHVFNPGQLTDSVAFSPTAELGIRNNISLNAMGGTATFNAIENDANVVPEPASFLLGGLGLTFAAAWVRRRSRAQDRSRLTATNG